MDSPFQSPSKWRFHCNLISYLQLNKDFNPFSLLVNGDFIVTDKTAIYEYYAIKLSVS